MLSPSPFVRRTAYYLVWISNRAEPPNSMLGQRTSGINRFYVNDSLGTVLCECVHCRSRVKVIFLGNIYIFAGVFCMKRADTCRLVQEESNWITNRLEPEAFEVEHRCCNSHTVNTGVGVCGV